MHVFRFIYVLVTVTLIGIGCAHRQPAPSGGPVAAAPTYSDRVAAAMQVRREALERAYGIPFDADWRPRVKSREISFETPLPELEMSYYNPETQSFELHWNVIVRMVVQPPSPALLMRTDQAAFEGMGRYENRIIELFDHELGHALADQVSRRLGRGVFPPPCVPGPDVAEEFIVWGILSEGVATFFGNTTVAVPRDWGEAFVPRAGANLRELSMANVYFGGYWIVRPILEADAQRGLAYIVTHPLVVTNGDVHTAALAYQREALAALGTIVP